MKQFCLVIVALFLLIGMAACQRTPDSGVEASLPEGVVTNVGTLGDDSREELSESEIQSAGISDALLSDQSVGEPSAPPSTTSTPASSSVPSSAVESSSTAALSSKPAATPSVPDWEKAYDVPKVAPEDSFSYSSCDTFVTDLTSEKIRREGAEADLVPDIQMYVGNIRHVTRQSLFRQNIQPAFMPVPRLTANGAKRLKDGGLSVYETYVYYDFYETGKDPQNREMFSISVRPLTEEMEHREPRDLVLPGYDGVKQGEHNGLTYYFMEGDPDDPGRYLTSAFFVQDGFLIKIQLFGPGKTQPWDDAYFDYFTFEKVEF